MPSFSILKFGGSSLDGPERLKQALALIEEASGRGRVAVVVSAIGSTTDRLLAAASAATAGDGDRTKALVEEIGATARACAAGGAGSQSEDGLDALLFDLQHQLGLVREQRGAEAAALDGIMSFGERISAQVITRTLRSRGRTTALCVDSRDWTVTDTNFGAARVDLEATQRRVDELRGQWESCVSVHTGFLGRAPDGRTTTLGRNGSDYTAALLAQLLGATELTRWTDVSGIMTADPEAVREAYPVRRLSYEEALELADLGWKVLHPRTIWPLVQDRIPLHIRNSLNPQDPGTTIDAAGNPDEDHPACITSLEGLALLGLEWKRTDADLPIGEQLLQALGDAGIDIWMATQSPHGRSLALAISEASLDLAQSIVRRELENELQRGSIDALTVQKPVTLVTLVAEAMGRTVNVAGRFFGSLGGVGIPVRASAQGASSRSISAVIDAGDTTIALRTIHATFNLAHQEVSLLILGKGVVGSQLLAQLEGQRDRLKLQEGVSLRLFGLSDRRHLLFGPDVTLEGWRDRLAAAEPNEPARMREALEQLRRLPVPVLVDCTAADGMEVLYEEALRSGIHVVTSNKKPLALPWPQRQRLMTQARRSYRAYHYETTVGASLPVIETLKDLVRTGDRVQLIEGSLSGTLGYLCDELMSGVALSEAVRVAREKGYTEPHPREDLLGLDAGRKALILARELGLPLEMAQVQVEPFVPPHLLQELDLERFFHLLQSYDEVLAQQIGQYRKEGKVLRYLARIDPEATAGPLQVGPVAVDARHPAARLRGTEAFVAFTTDRYRQYPLIVQGAGAGGEVTAAGVLSDILRVAQRLRGR